MSPLDKAPRTGISPHAWRKRKPTGIARLDLLNVETDQRTHPRTPPFPHTHTHTLPEAHIYLRILCWSEAATSPRRPLARILPPLHFLLERLQRAWALCWPFEFDYL